MSKERKMKPNIQISTQFNTKRGISCEVSLPMILLATKISYGIFSFFTERSDLLQVEHIRCDWHDQKNINFPNPVLKVVLKNTWDNQTLTLICEIKIKGKKTKPTEEQTTVFCMEKERETARHSRLDNINFEEIQNISFPSDRFSDDINAINKLIVETLKWEIFLKKHELSKIHEDLSDSIS